MTNMRKKKKRKKNEEEEDEETRPDTQHTMRSRSC